MSENILSVGVDIGTSTTCVVFSDILIDNSSAAMRLPRAEIIEKKVRYRSPVYFTPLLSDTELNVEEIAGIVAREYQSAGISPEDVQTGAVIITGDTARKSNAQRCLQAISRYAGDFVVAADRRWRASWPAKGAAPMPTPKPISCLYATWILAGEPRIPRHSPAENW